MAIATGTAMATASRASPKLRRWHLPPPEVKHERDERRWSRGRPRPGWRWTRRLSDAPPVLPATQVLPVLGAERTQDRLQGREDPATLRIRARQDRAEPHHGGLCQETARARAGDQTGALLGPVALRDALKETRSWCK